MIRISKHKKKSKYGAQFQLGFFDDLLVGELFAENGDAHADAGKDGLWESGADGQAVDEVVDSVTKDDHPSHRRYLGPPVLGFQLKKNSHCFREFVYFLLFTRIF